MAKTTKTKSANGSDFKIFFDTLGEVAAEKGLSLDEVTEVLKSSIITAYQKQYGTDARLSVVLDKDTPEIAVICRLDVAETVEEPSQQISLSDAKKTHPDAVPGETIEIKEDPFGFSRIGATNVKQIFLQRLKEMEREIIYNEFKAKEGDLINGFFLRWRDRDLMYIDLGKAEGVMPRKEQIPGEKFRTGDRVKAVIQNVDLRREKSRDPGPVITLSRASGDFVKKLFEMEIPEIYDGVVDILAVARTAGFRTKLLVTSNRSDVDPVGACVGIKGVRIQSIVRELGNERIDIINFSEDPAVLISNAMTPAKVTEVRVDSAQREALVIVGDDQYSLAIGNNGMNVRLASQLTGYRLLVKSQTQFAQEISTPEARARLDEIFSKPVEPVAYQADAETEGDDELTPLDELPLSSRIIAILEDAGIRSVEELVEKNQEELEAVPGLGKTTARQIMKIIQENVEFEED